MSDYAKLEVWRKAHALTLEVYRETGVFPKSEMFGLTSQIRRSAASIGANLAEGCGRRSDRELRRFIRIAVGSSNELDYHLLLACDLSFLNAETAEVLRSKNSEIGKMLTGLLSRINYRLGTRNGEELEPNT